MSYVIPSKAKYYIEVKGCFRLQVYSISVALFRFDIKSLQK